MGTFLSHRGIPEIKVCPLTTNVAAVCPHTDGALPEREVCPLTNEALPKKKRCVNI